MSNRTPSEFKAAVKEHNLTEWVVGECVECDVPYSFMSITEGVFIDKNCECHVRYKKLEPSSWEAVANRFNMILHPSEIKRHNIYWHFAGEFGI